VKHGPVEALVEPRRNLPHNKVHRSFPIVGLRKETLSHFSALLLPQEIFRASSTPAKKTTVKTPAAPHPSEPLILLFRKAAELRSDQRHPIAYKIIILGTLEGFLQPTFRREAF
jgi:hypothetical protein